MVRPEPRDKDSLHGTPGPAPQTGTPLNNIGRRIAGVIILVGFIYLVERYFGWRRLLSPWATLPLWAILLAALLAFLSYGLRAVRLYDYFRAELRDGFAACCKLTLQHNLLNNFLPMRSGELSF